MFSKNSGWGVNNVKNEAAIIAFLNFSRGIFILNYFLTPFLGPPPLSEFFSVNFFSQSYLFYLRDKQRFQKSETIRNSKL